MLKKLDFHLSVFNTSRDIFTIYDIITYINDSPCLYDLDLNKPLIIHLVDCNNNNILYRDILILGYASTDLVCWKFFSKLNVYIEKHLKNTNEQVGKNYLAIFISNTYSAELDITDLMFAKMISDYELYLMNRDISWFDLKDDYYYRWTSTY